MRQLHLRVQALPRPAEGLAPDGEKLSDLVRRAVARGAAAPVAVVVRPERTELLALAPIAQAGLAIRSFLAGLTASGEAHPSDPDRPPLGRPVAVGIAGQFRWRSGGQSAASPIALAFLEGPDCAWWHWQALLDAQGSLLEDTAFERSAEAGDPLPAGLGRWWSLARRTGAVVRYGTPTRTGPPPAESPLVH